MSGEFCSGVCKARFVPEPCIHKINENNLIFYQYTFSFRFRNWLGYDDGQFEFLKQEQLEQAGKEEETQRQLTAQQNELRKQKKAVKLLTQQIDDQSELLKKIAAHLGIDEDVET